MRPLEEAAALLALAMRESHGPVEVLACALERMAAALALCTRELERTAHGDAGASAQQRMSAADIERMRAALARDITVCIESLQFHDRLMQRLTAVRNCLTGQGPDPAVAPAGEPRELQRAELASGSIELF